MQKSLLVQKIIAITIRDTDYAEEAANLTAQNIIQQMAAAMLTQGNVRGQLALSLISG